MTIKRVGTGPNRPVVTGAAMALLLFLLLGILAGCTQPPQPAVPAAQPAQPDTDTSEEPADAENTSEATVAYDPATSMDRRTVADIEFLGVVTFDNGYEVEGTQMGGLSGITYDAANDVYYAISDDRSEHGPARFYTMKIDLSDNTLEEPDVEFTAVTTLLDENGKPFAEKSLDPEGIDITREGVLYISSEGEASDEHLTPPFVRAYTLEGQYQAELPVDEKFLPTEGETSGIRNNMAFENLTLQPDQHYLYVAAEGALKQDGPLARGLEEGEDEEAGQSLARVIKYDLESNESVAEMVYIVDPAHAPPDPADGFYVSGMVDLLAIDNNGTFLTLERSYSEGHGFSIKMFQVLTQGALNVITEDDLYYEDEDMPFSIDPPIQKDLLLDFATLDITLENVEGLALGPTLSDGRQSLIVVSDNNFSDTEQTQVMLMALTLNITPAAAPALETPRYVDNPDEANAGDSDDPAIWVHPTDPAQSRVIATLKDGGLVVFNLEGEIVQTYMPAEYSEVRYNNVDLVYGFALGDKTVDLAVVSDRANDTLVIFAIDPDSGELTDITSDAMLETIFGVDDGEQTAYGLATYTSVASGTSYAFVTQRDGNQVAQLALNAEDDGTVSAEVVRLIAFPIPEGGEATDSQMEGMVVDRETGVLYVGMEDEFGVFKMSAEPDQEEEPVLVQSIEEDYLQPDIEGLTIYYGPDGTGYLLVSSQGDSTYAVFSRQGDNEYLGSFVVADSGDIDQANESDGADVSNVALGDRFPNGLLVVQDGANDEQYISEDDEELENSSTGFKFVPWENVAAGFERVYGESLVVDPASYHPRAA